MRGCFWTLVWVCAFWGLCAIGNFLCDLFLSMNTLVQAGFIVCGVAFAAFLVMKVVDELD
jgi:hypothetical protein